MRALTLFGILAFATFATQSFADVTVASPKYVQDQVETKVDVSAGTQQTLNGEYTVSETGVLKVPTPPLPTDN